VDPAQVVAITQWVATPMLHTMGRPLAEKQRPDTGYAAKFSGPYTFASALLGGSGLGLGPDDFSDALAMDARRRDLMAKVTVEADRRCDEVFPSQAPCIVEVETSDANHRRRRFG